MSDRRRVLIIEARFYEQIADDLAKGAIAVLDAANVDYDRIAVPGAFEIPPVIAMDLEAENGPSYDGYITLGCVIRGETDHYDHICRETSRSIMDLAVLGGAALGFGVLTCENMAQAVARADVAQKNKGKDVAEACLRMIELTEQFRGGSK